MSRESGLAERVRLMALRGELRAGERRGEGHLAEALKTSRRRLREALRRLEGEGLLVADHDGGMRLVAPGPGEVEDALQLRAALEALAAALAARRVRAGALEPAEVGALGGAAATLLEDRAFHRSLSALAANRACHVALDRVWDRLVVAGAPLPDDGGDHAALLSAVAAGDDEAAEALARRHALAALADHVR